MENVPKKPNEKLRILLIAILQGNRRIDRSVGELEFWKTPSVSRDTTILMGIDSCPGIPLCWNNHVSVWRQGNYTSSPPWRPFFHHPGKKKNLNLLDVQAVKGIKDKLDQQATKDHHATGH